MQEWKIGSFPADRPGAPITARNTVSRKFDSRSGRRSPHRGHNWAKFGASHRYDAGTDGPNGQVRAPSARGGAERPVRPGRYAAAVRAASPGAAPRGASARDRASRGPTAPDAEP